MKAFLEKYPRVAELPFDSDRKLMSTVHPLPDGKFLVAVKGCSRSTLETAVLPVIRLEMLQRLMMQPHLIKSNNSEMAPSLCVCWLVPTRLLTVFQKLNF